MVAALICSGSGWITTASAGGVVLQTPAGLKPGDQFRFAFLTDGMTNAESSDISTYDSFVQTQAGGATYNGATVKWRAIGSTATVDAINHIGQTQTPVYLVDGTEVTTSTTISGLWSSTLMHAIDEDITGATLPPSFVWTGTEISGVAGVIDAPLGSNAPLQGFAFFASTGTQWVEFGTNGSVVSANLYGISAVQTVVPEPSSMVLLCTGGVMVVAFIGRRRDRRPVVGPTDVP
jgi:hypothetical protein